MTIPGPEETTRLDPSRPRIGVDPDPTIGGDPGRTAEFRPADDTTVGRACDDLVERWRKGERPPVEAFRDRWPGGSPGPDELFELVYTEYLIRQELGEPEPEDLARRFPSVADRLRNQVEVHKLLLGPQTLTLHESHPRRAGAGVGVGVEAADWSSLVDYKVRRVLGRGGMGVVYEAIQVRLNRPVALKMIRAGAQASAEDRARFLAEAEIIVRLRHPNIVQIHAFGDSDGQPFFEMELVDGGSLADRLDGSPRPVREASSLIETVARAVHEAHRRGVVHRDLKPSNILLMADGTPKIVDFGLAKLIDADSELTRTNSILGSPAYMAPEQAAGQASSVGPAADVFALGVIYYETLTGRKPFVAESALETMDLVRHAEPVPPSRLRPGLPRDVETICLRCLAKDPSRRYETAEALADDLGRWLRGESIRARPTGLLERGYRWSLRNRAVAGLVAAIALLLVGGTTGMAWLWSRARAEAANASSLALKESKANVELTRVSAGLMLDRGLALAEAGDAARGLPFMARAIELDPDRRGGLDQAARSNLAAWAPTIPGRTGLGRLPPTVWDLARSPDRRVAAIGGEGFFGVWDDDRSRLLLAGGPRPGETTNRVAIRPDGRVAATLSIDKNLVRLWDLASGLPLGPSTRVPPGDGQLAFRPGGSSLALAFGPTLRFWDPGDGRAAGEPIALAGGARSMSFSPDGSTLLVLANDASRCDRLDGRTGRPLGPPILLDAPGWTAVFSPDGSRFAVGYGQIQFARQFNRDHSGVQCFETATGRPVGPRLPHASGQLRVAFRPDGQVLLSGDSDGVARLWDAAGRPIGDPLKNEGGIDGLDFSPDGSLAVTHSNAGPMRLWDVATATQVGSTIVLPAGNLIGFSGDASRLLATAGDRVYSHDLTGAIAPVLPPRPASKILQFFPDGRAYVGVFEKVAQAVSTVDGGPIGWPMSHQDFIQVIAFSPDGRLVATGSRDATVRIWDAQGRPTRPPIRLRHWASALRFGPDGRRLLAADEAGDVRLIDLATGATLGTPQNHPARFVGSHVMDLHFSKDGKVGYSVGNAGLVGRVDGITGIPHPQPWDFSPRLESSQLSPDDRTLLLVHREAVRLIDLGTGLDRFPPLGRGVLSAVYTPDGRTIVAGCSDRMARFWDAATGRPAGSPIPHHQPVASVAISPDGRTLSTMTTDGQARVWDLAGRKQVGPARSSDPRLARPEFSPDGKFLVVTDRATRLHRLEGPEPGPPEGLAGRVAGLTGLGLDAQGAITPADDAASPVPPPKPAGDGAGGWHFRAGVDLDARGLHDAARWHLDRAVADGPDDWMAHAARSDALARLGLAAESAAEAESARTLAGPLLSAQWDARRGFDADREGRWADAVAAFDRVLALGPPDPPLYHDARGWARAHLGDWAGASADLAAGPWRHSAMLVQFEHAILVALAAGDRDFYRLVIGHLTPPGYEHRPGSQRSASQIAEFAALAPGSLDDPQRLVSLAEPASRLVDDVEGAAFRLNLGLALYRADRFEEAIDRLTSTVGGHLISEDFQARCFLAMAHRRLGRPQEARRWLDLAEHEPDPGDEWRHIIRELSLREAEAVVLDADFPADPFQPPSPPPRP